jgi:hypothetical protein
MPLIVAAIVIACQVPTFQASVLTRWRVDLLFQVFPEKRPATKRHDTDIVPCIFLHFPINSSRICLLKIVFLILLF